MSFTEVFVLFVMTIIIVMIVQNHFSEVEYVKSTVDGRNYLVCKLPQKQQAADYLADINSKLMRLIKHMVAKYSTKDVYQLYSNYNPDYISEGSHVSGFTSYTVGKSKLVLCIRQKDNSFVEKNTIMYVAIHELAHMMTPETGHTPSFWSNFKILLEEAISIGLYKKVDFANKPQDYCGIQITSSIV